MIAGYYVAVFFALLYCLGACSSIVRYWTSLDTNAVVHQTWHGKVHKRKLGVRAHAASVSLKVIAMRDTIRVACRIAEKSDHDGGDPHNNKEHKTNNVGAVPLNMFGPSKCAQMSTAVTTFLHRYHRDERIPQYHFQPTRNHYDWLQTLWEQAPPTFLQQ